MDYKEKYEQALEKVRVMLGTGDYTRESLEYVFPELKELEDKRIREALINGFNKLDKSAVWYNGITNAQILDWLEKQSEHANFRNKIQIGDKVTRNRDGMLVNLSQLNRVAKVEEKQGEQKPTDEEIKILLRTEYEKGRADVIAKQKPAWSEEDEMFVHGLIRGLAAKRDIHGHTTFSSDCIDITETINWLEFIKYRVQPKQEWSEEDEEHIKSLLERLEGMCKKDATFIRTKFAVSEDEDWLKSIRPHSQWKPSDEQMEAVKRASNGSRAIYGNDYLIMESLYQDLKKLKEE